MISAVRAPSSSPLANGTVTVGRSAVGKSGCQRYPQPPTKLELSRRLKNFKLFTGGLCRFCVRIIGHHFMVVNDRGGNFFRFFEEIACLKEVLSKNFLHVGEEFCRFV